MLERDAEIGRIGVSGASDQRNPAMMEGPREPCWTHVVVHGICRSFEPAGERVGGAH